ncbi:MAG: TauD/TfdA family dioxygenase [Rhodospirillales bacterium]
MDGMGSKIKVVPSGASLGADVSDFDIRNVSAAEFEEIHQAWLDHLVLRIRGQAFDDHVQRDFSRLFGPLELSPKTKFTGKPWLEGFPEISQITNKKVNGEAVGTLGNLEAFWHTDMSYIETPPKGSLLHALEIPPTGGDTHFLNMYEVLDALPKHLRQAVEGRSIKHEGVHSSDGSIRRGTKVPESGDVRDYPGAIHPIVRTHPETKRRALFLGRRVNAYVMGLPVDESEDLLDALWDFASSRRDLTWTQQWQIGDMVIWDNRCAMHARDGFSDDHIRLMHRTVLLGDKPY